MAPAGAPLVTLATAHPAKFPDAMRRAVGREAPLPPQLEWMMHAAERCTILPDDLAAIEADLLMWIEGAS
jgi:threonine synthase